MKRKGRPYRDVNTKRGPYTGSLLGTVDFCSHVMFRFSSHDWRVSVSCSPKACLLTIVCMLSKPWAMWDIDQFSLKVRRPIETILLCNRLRGIRNKFNRSYFTVWLSFRMLIWKSDKKEHQFWVHFNELPTIHFIIENVGLIHEQSFISISFRVPHSIFSHLCSLGLDYFVSEALSWLQQDQGIL